jgi:hypothetical protein
VKLLELWKSLMTVVLASSFAVCSLVWVRLCSVKQWCVVVGSRHSLTCQALYFTYWYLKEEQAKRIGLFISFGALAGALGGLISVSLKQYLA